MRHLRLPMTGPLRFARRSSCMNQSCFKRNAADEVIILSTRRDTKKYKLLQTVRCSLSRRCWHPAGQCATCRLSFSMIVVCRFRQNWVRLECKSTSADAFQVWCRPSSVPLPHGMRQARESPFARRVFGRNTTRRRTKRRSREEMWPSWSTSSRKVAAVTPAGVPAAKARSPLLSTERQRFRYWGEGNKHGAKESPAGGCRRALRVVMS